MKSLADYYIFFQSEQRERDEREFFSSFFYVIFIHKNSNVEDESEIELKTSCASFD
jgi:hypothetical protein